MWRLPLLAILLSAELTSGDGDPLLALLAQDDDPARRSAIEDLLRAGGGDGCERLSGYARARDGRVRENAVRTMGDVGCSVIDDYRPYFSDGSAWVADALLDALSRNRLEEGVPYAMARLSDRRRLVSDGGSSTIAQAAERALRAMTAQPIASARPAGSQGSTVPTEAAWRAWYAAHGHEPAAAWIASGLESMRAALAGNSAARRLDALETAALVGEPGRALLAEALRREPSDLTAALACMPDEPPRVTDLVPCVMTIRNGTSHRQALAPGDLDVEVARREAPPGEARSSGPAHDAVRERARPSAKGGSRDAAPSPSAPKVDTRQLGGRLIDLGPGESLRRQVRIGPVASAGRYEVQVELTDLWEHLDPGSYKPPPIKAALVLRFEQ